MYVLVTGGLGYIGSHTAIALLAAGHNVVVLDNLQNSNVSIVTRIEVISERKIVFVQGDIRDQVLVHSVLVEHRIEAVLHFAGLKVVEESICDPLDYFDCNITGTIELCAAMKMASVNTLVFSSSASVYGNAGFPPFNENQENLHPTNPYARSKLIIENMLTDLAESNSDWNIASLRYFNPAGAHDSGMLGEDPINQPSNLIPFVSKVASGKLNKLRIFGNDYNTADGTGVRDYIHIMDLADGHIAALEYLHNNEGNSVFNLGIGKGASVLEVIREFENVSKKTIPFEVFERRMGDVAESWADVARAERLLGWKARRSLSDMCLDAWRWEHDGSPLLGEDA